MKRRQLLGTAGAAAVVSLTGCGGGSDLDSAGNVTSDVAADIEPNLALNTIPGAVVPESGHYQVEVVFQSTRAMTVSIANLVRSVQIAKKDVTKGSSHKVGWAMFRCTTQAKNTKDDFALLVHEANQTPTSAGIGSTAANGFRKYGAYDNGAVEYEWNFYSKSDKALLVSVRFFPLAVKDYPFATDQYVVPISNSSHHVNGGGNTKTLPKLHATKLQVTSHEASVIHSASNGRDTLCLPNLRGLDGHDELVPVYLAASDAEKLLLQRRLVRHVARFATKARETHVMNSQDDVDVHHSLGNEILRVMGGQSLIDHLSSTRDKIKNSIATNLKQMGDTFFNFCAAELPKLSSDKLFEANRKLAAAVDKDEVDGNVAGGVSLTTSLQISAFMREADFPWPGFNVGGGFRLSLTLTQHGFKYTDLNVESVVYDVRKIKTSGLKMGVVFIIKGFSSEIKYIGKYDADIEVSINFTVLGDKWRLDSVVLDPVMDFDTRTFVGKLVGRGIKNVEDGVGVPEISNPPLAEVWAEDAGLGDSAIEMQTFSGSLGASDAEYVSPNVNNLMEYPLEVIEKALIKTNMRFWGTAEVSWLRFVMPNEEVRGDVGFNAGFVYGGVGWVPGAKYIMGYGVQRDYSYPPKVNGVAAPGTTLVTGFIRTVAVVDAFVCIGSTKFIKSASFPRGS